MFYILSLSLSLLCFRSRKTFFEKYYLYFFKIIFFFLFFFLVFVTRYVYCYCYFYFLTYISRGVIFNLYFKRLSCTFETVFSLFIKLEASKYRTVICSFVFICFHFCGLDAFRCSLRRRYRRRRRGRQRRDE